MKQCPKCTIKLVRCSEEDSIYYCKLCGKFYDNSGLVMKLAEQKDYDKYRRCVY